MDPFGLNTSFLQNPLRKVTNDKPKSLQNYCQSKTWNLQEFTTWVGYIGETRTVVIWLTSVQKPLPLHSFTMPVRNKSTTHVFENPMWIELHAPTFDINTRLGVDRTKPNTIQTIHPSSWSNVMKGHVYIAVSLFLYNTKYNSWWWEPFSCSKSILAPSEFWLWSFTTNISPAVNKEGVF